LKQALRNSRSYESSNRPTAEPAAEPASAAKLESISAATNPSVKPKPLVVTKSPELRKVSNPSLVTNTPEPISSQKPVTPKKFDVITDAPATVSSPSVLAGERKMASLPTAASSMPLTPSKSKLNTPKPPKPLFDITTKAAPSTPLSNASGLGLQLGSASKKLTAAPELTPPPEPEAARYRVGSSPTKSSPTKPKGPSAATARLESFFGPLPKASDKAEFDTQAFLASQRSVPRKTKTLSNHMWEVTGDGKRSPMPAQQEHILFEDCMYLGVHSMQTSNGSKSTEVYLWCGDEVPEAAVEDSQLFCRKIARENSAKLEMVKQGKESPAFFQALGGIVITRRSKSSALYMLCGRRHLGHVAFDEVDFSVSSLCSGFPFLISSKFGKLYLWKGAGSNAEEIGCARLIGMDLGLTGEIEEVSEGEEPSSFWEAFPSRTQKRAASDRTKTIDEEAQPPKLYRVEHDRPKSSRRLLGLEGTISSQTVDQSYFGTHHSVQSERSGRESYSYP